MTFSGTGFETTASFLWMGHPAHGEKDPFGIDVLGTPQNDRANAEKGEEASEDTLPDRTADARRLRVVIVEDEAIVAMDLEMMLERLGAEVVGIAVSAAEAEALVIAHHPDLVTMDINIKGDRDGVTAAQHIVENYDIRPIFISAYSDTAMRQRAEPCHAIAWIEKPIHPKDLADALALVERNGD